MIYLQIACQFKNTYLIHKPMSRHEISFFILNPLNSFFQFIEFILGLLFDYKIEIY